MLFERDANKLGVGVGDGRPDRLRALKPLAFDGIANGIGMNGQFPGDGADLPVFGIKIAADLCAGFVVDHSGEPPSFWNTWKRIDEAPWASADPATQRECLRLFRQTLARPWLFCGNRWLLRST